MEKPTEVEVKKPTYVNRETGEVLTDEISISHYKSMQEEEIVNNLLIGEFTKDGLYNIDKDYLLELVAVKKIIKEEFNGKYILESSLKSINQTLRFTLTILKDETTSKKMAVLKFVEVDQKLDEENRELLRTVVARYKDDDDQYFMIKVRKVFNIVEADESEGKDASELETVARILARLGLLKTLKIGRGAKIDLIAKEYVDNVLAILKNNPGKFSEHVLRKYLLLINKEKEKGKIKYIKIKFLLDNIIDQAKKQTNQLEVLNQIDLLRQQYVQQSKSINKELTAPSKEKEVKKAEEVKSSSSGSSSGAKKSGGAKAKPKAATKKVSSPAKKKQNPAFKPQPIQSKGISEAKIEKKLPIGQGNAPKKDLGVFQGDVENIVDSVVKNIEDKVLDGYLGNMMVKTAGEVLKTTLGGAVVNAEGEVLEITLGNREEVFVNLSKNETKMEGLQTLSEKISNNQSTNNRSRELDL